MEKGEERKEKQRGKKDVEQNARMVLVNFV